MFMDEMLPSTIIPFALSDKLALPIVLKGKWGLSNQVRRLQSICSPGLFTSVVYTVSATQTRNLVVR